MADKMIKNAGRGDDGLAKAIRTNNSGNIRTSKIKETKRARYVDDIPSGETITLVDTKKEVIVHSLICEFTNDSTNQESFLVNIGNGSASLTSYSVFVENSSHSTFITPSHCVYDPLFETLVNEPGRRIVQLKNELQVKGLKISLRNRGKNPNAMKFLCFYSEVE